MAFLLSLLLITPAMFSATPEIWPDVITTDASRFTAFLSSPLAERRVEGLQGLAHLKHWLAEAAVLRLLDDVSPLVRREAMLALGRLGGACSIPRFIALLDDPSWEIRQNAWLGLCVMTAQDLPETDTAAWTKWWNDSTPAEKEKAILAIANGPPATAARGAKGAQSNSGYAPSAPGRRGRQRSSVLPPAHPERRNALRALVRLATPSGEGALLQLLQRPQSPPLDPEERNFVCEALERTGTSRAIPVLAAQQSDSASWALGSLGGVEAERALLGFPKTLPVLLALDRLRSTNAGPFLPHLVAQMGLITYRGQPDDVMNRDLQPIQRVGANLIRRSGLAPIFFECVLQELEDTMKPPIAHGPRPDVPPGWEDMLRQMRSELKPGFVREDGTTTSQPVAALCYLVGEDCLHGDIARNGGAPRFAEEPARQLVRRLIPLLRHPAIVPRVYVALALGRLRAHEALPTILEMIREGYAFSDSVALASGKHFEHSQNVRWRGFLCLALGRLGEDGARKALEDFASDPKQSRDIRYCAVVGLGFIGSPDSLPALERVAAGDIIWLVRDEARHVARSIQLTKLEGLSLHREAGR